MYSNKNYIKWFYWLKVLPVFFDLCSPSNVFISLKMWGLGNQKSNCTEKFRISKKKKSEKRGWKLQIEWIRELNLSKIHTISSNARDKFQQIQFGNF